MSEVLTRDLELTVNVNERKEKFFLLREDVLSLSNELFEKRYVSNLAEGVFLKECSYYVWNRNQLESDVEILNVKINLKNNFPDLTRIEIDNKAVSIIYSLEEKRREVENHIREVTEKMEETSLSKGQEEDVREAKLLWRKLVRLLHPDMNPEEENNEVKTELLSEIYMMQELGENGYDLGKLLEIESKLKQFEKDFGKEQLSISNNVGQIERMIKALHKRKKEILKDIEKVEKSEAYRYREMLNNPEFIQEKILFLQRMIKEIENIIIDLEIEYNLLFDE